MIVYSLLILFIASINIPSGTKIDEPFKEYVRSFEIIYGASIDKKNVIMEFEKMEVGTAGYCQLKHYTFTGKIVTRRIMINPDVWKHLGEFDKENLIWHELGHCIAHAEHNDERREDYCPKSIMFPSIISYNCLIKYRDSFIEEVSNMEKFND